MEPIKHDAHVPSRSSARPSGRRRRGRRRRGEGGEGREGSEGSEVRAIARAAGRTCSRPGCETPAAATLVFSYQEQVARLVDLLEQGEPQAYDLCPTHADRTGPPVGWELSDTRPPPSDAPRRLDDDETVEVLAAALRGETPRTRVDVVEGGRVADPDDADDPDDPDESDESATADAADAARDDDADEAAVDAPGEQDPLRAALEELQRVAMPDDDVAVAVPASLLRGDASPAEVWDEVVSAREASHATEHDPDDEPTLW